MEGNVAFKDSLASFAGGLCEIKAQNGESLLFGRLSAINTKFSLSFNVVSGDGSELMEIRYETPVTAVLKKEDRFLVLKGEIALANKLFWRVSHLQLVQDTEKRTFFRIRTNSNCKLSNYVETSDDEFLNMHKEPEFDGRVVDLSLTGVKLRSEHEFERSDHIVVSGIRFDNIKNLKLKCRIIHKAVFEKPDKIEYIYGCEFLDLSRHTTDLICRDIFEAQRVQLKQKVI